MAMEGKVPRISIGMPVYNGERFLAQVLDSLLAQTYKDFELVICDNCSTDGTERICRSYAAKDSRISYHRNITNIGAARNSNLAFSLSRGEYFKWAADDDICGPEFVERCVDVLDRRDEAVLCYPKTCLIGESGAAISDYDDRLDLQWEAPNKRLAYLLWNIRMCNAVYGLIRSSALRSVKPFGSFSNSDISFLAELALHGLFVEIPEKLLFRRIFELSAVKYASPHDRMLIFEPDKATQLSLPNWRLFIGFLSAIRRAPIGATERLYCYGRMRIWLERWGSGLFQDLKIAARYCLRRGHISFSKT